MPKLIDDRPACAIGEHGVLNFIDELNQRRAFLGVRERYRPIRVRGELTAERHLLPKGDEHKPSPTYSAPRLVDA